MKLLALNNELRVIEQSNGARIARITRPRGDACWLLYMTDQDGQGTDVTGLINEPDKLFSLTHQLSGIKSPRARAEELFG